MTKELIGGLLAVTAALPLSAAPRLVADGILGQSGERADPVKVSEFSLCLNDTAGNVVLSDGWTVPASGGKPVRKPLPKGMLPYFISDGHDVWNWNEGSLWMTRMETGPDGLVASSEKYHLASAGGSVFLAPYGCKSGFAAQGRFFVFVRKAMEIRVFKPSEKAFVPVFAYADRVPDPQKVRRAALHPKTGALLLAYDWPQSCVRRFGTDGVEVVRGGWPARVLADSFAQVGDHVFAIGYSAYELSDMPGGLFFGKDCSTVRGIARGKDGWWLGTTQGAQFYSDTMIGKSDEPAVRRVGGLVGVDALELSGGRVLICQGPNLQSVWLDDRRDEPLSSDRQWARGFNVFGGYVTSVEGVDGGAFLFRHEQGDKSAVWRFDPRKVWYRESKQRLVRVTDGTGPTRPVNEATVGGYRAVAADGTLKLLDGSRCVWSRKLGATLLAGEGDRLVAYVPELAGIVRFRLEN